jgi:hypothetical protein
MKSLKLLSFTCIALSLVASAGAHADIFGGLSPDDQAKVNNGEQAVVTEDVDGSAWPNVTVYQRVEATPDEVAAVMFDYSLHKSMFDSLTESTPVKKDAKETDVKYTMTFPKVLGISLPDEHYVVHDVLAPMDGGYQISWTMVKASSMKDCSGSAKFEKLGNGTLVAYNNFINPPRPSLAKLIVSMAVTRVQDTVKALAKQTLNERNGDQAKLNAQKSALAGALGQ